MDVCGCVCVRIVCVGGVGVCGCVSLWIVGVSGVGVGVGVSESVCVGVDCGKE